MNVSFGAKAALGFLAISLAAPALAQQSQGNIQLKAFASGDRKPVAGNVQMQQIAARLTDEEMKAVASYLQGMR